MHPWELSDHREQTKALEADSELNFYSIYKDDGNKFKSEGPWNHPEESVSLNVFHALKEN